MAKGEYKETVKRITGRTVEVPYLFENLKDGNILDVGSEASIYIGELLKMGKEVTRVDVRKIIKFNVGNEIIIEKDIREVEEGQYDNILFIGSLEHMSLKCDPYGTKEDWIVSPIDEQLKIIRHCYDKLLKNNGRIILTLPYGKYTNGGWYIVYDKSVVESIEKEFKVINKKYFTVKFGIYMECVENEVDMSGGMELMPDLWERDKNLVCLTIQKSE
jgi:hypothetical protein